MCLNRPELAFLGHIVNKDGIQVDPKKTATVRDWPTPTNVTEVRQFLGLVNYFRKFIQGHSTLVAPMTNLLRKGVDFVWSPDCQRAFEDVKVALTHPPVLAMPDPSKPFTVIADASLVGHWCCTVTV
jgi:hypothetical protein